MILRYYLKTPFQEQLPIARRMTNRQNPFLYRESCRAYISDPHTKALSVGPICTLYLKGR